MCANARKNRAVLQVYYTLGSGGVERVIHSISAALREQGVASHLLVIGSHPGRVTTDEFDSVRVLSTSWPPPIRAWRIAASIGAVRRSIERASDARCKILVHTPGIWAGLLSRDDSELVFHSIESEMSKPRSAAWTDVFRRSLRALAFSRRQIVAVSEGVREDLAKTYLLSRGRIRVIKNAVKVAAVLARADAYQTPIEGRYVLHIGRFNEVKQQKHLIQAARFIDADIQICFMGDGSDAFRTTIASELATDTLARKVRFLPYRENPYPIIKSACCLVLCSRTEAMPMVAIEALTLGVPVISYDSPTGPREILGERNPEWLVPLNDINALATGINTIIETPPEVDISYYRMRHDAANLCRGYLE
jgi:glycosyltransferase involved in cell wall biosynthesis